MGGGRLVPLLAQPVAPFLGGDWLLRGDGEDVENIVWIFVYCLDLKLNVNHFSYYISMQTFPCLRHLRLRSVVRHADAPLHRPVYPYAVRVWVVPAEKGLLQPLAKVAHFRLGVIKAVR